MAAACWLAGLLLLGAAAHRRALALRLRFMPIFAAALWPASFAMSFLLLPENYGLNGMGVGNAWYSTVSTFSSLLPFAGSVVLGAVLLRDSGAAEASAAVAVAPGAERGPAIRRVARALRTTRSPVGTSATAAGREKELLGELRRHGELTVAGAALETSLTVEEADQMLSALAAKGHLEVRIEQGRLLYSLWERDAPDA